MERSRHRDLAVDLVLAGIVAAAGLAEVWVPLESVQGTGSPIVSSVAIVLAGCLLALRRRAPIALVGVPATWVLAGIVTLGDLQILFFGELVPMYFALYSGIRFGRPRAAAAVAGSVALAVVIADLTIPYLQDASELLFHWGILIAIALIALGVRRSEARAVAAALRAERSEAEARHAAMLAVAEERARIARELHDILGHSMSVVVVQAGAAAEVVDDDPVAVRRALEAIRSIGRDSLAEVRRVVALLREDEEAGLAPVPGIDRLPDLIAQARDAGLDVTYSVVGNVDALSAGRGLAVYRVVQEALTNVRRHANARSAAVVVTATPDAVTVTVTDDGGGHAASGAAGHGLFGMRERVAIYGGELEAGPQEGGWHVRAELPVLGPS
ncbi:two-component sensor histidine kinase [Agromyces rhizosphaerae]|uniref:histidine kinase n=1 Tax=Agromyces rhizosphaerae TaxID=88374 RepID=A0A9W6FQN4_9MICO|nr:histidine kinase [Agromyces rhizosphaerae]GLI28741.1 two-component sensor histidine kinase [Agromyces rhizosphaerae]